MALKRKAGPGLREGKSALPEPIPGEAFDILSALERCTCMLSYNDAAKLLGVDRSTVKRQVDAGKIPAIDTGLGHSQINPWTWAKQIELRNPHLTFTRRAQLRRAA